MNQYDYMRQLSEASAIPQEIRAIPGYREPTQAFMTSEMNQRLQSQQMANRAQAEKFAIGQAKRGFETEKRLYKTALPIAVAGIGLEAYRSWQQYLTNKNQDIMLQLEKDRRNAIMNTIRQYPMQIMQAIRTGQAERSVLEQNISGLSQPTPPVYPVGE